MGSHLRQIHPSSCGYTAIKALLIALGRGEGYACAYEPEVSQAPSLLDLMRYGEGLGVRLTPWRAGPPSIISISCLSTLPILAITNVRGTSHAIVVLAQKGRFLFVFDPAKGYSIWRKRRFLRLWSGVYLRPDAVTAPRKEKEKTPPAYLTLPALIAVSAFPSFLLLGAATYPLFSLGFMLFLLGSLLAFLLSRLFLRRIMKKMDHHALPRLLEAKDRKRRYEAYQTYKGKILSLTLRLSSLLTSVVILVTLCFLQRIELFALALSLTTAEIIVSLFLHKAIYPSINRSFEAHERSFYDQGDEASLKQLFRKQGRYASLLDATLAFRLVLLLAALGIYGYCLRLSLPELILPFFLCLPLKDVGESLACLEKEKEECFIAQTIYQNQECGDSSLKRETSP